MHAFYDKVTDRARLSLDRSNEYAKKNGDPLVTPLHVLYGILDEGENVAVLILKNLGVDTVELKAKVLGAIGKGTYKSAEIAVPYDSAVCRLICVAIEYGISIKHIGCHHLLKAILQNDDDPAYVLLTKENVNMELVDTQIKSSVKKV